jgi:hypothetical protein
VKIFSDKSLSIKETWINSFKLYNQSVKLVLSQAAVLGFASVAISLLSRFAKLSFTMKEITAQNITCSALSLILFLVTVCFGGVILHRINQIATDRAQSPIRESFKLIWQKYPKILVAASMSLVVYLAGFFLFILPGMCLMVLLAFVQPLIILDDHNVLNAFKNSFKMALGNWWSTCAVIVPLILLNFSVTFTTQFALPNYLWWLGIIIAGLFTIFYNMLLQSFVLTQFNNLKLLKTK